jgi:tRNA(fMet)-specific endonuclease VapC
LIIDTNALSAWRDADIGLLPILQRAAILLLPVIVIGEYLYGTTRSRERTQAEVWLEQVIASTPVASVGLATAAIYSRVRSTLRDVGRPIPDNDAWIAALALEHRLPVLSRDTHFDSVGGVTRIGW